MTRTDGLLMLVDGGLKKKFAEADICHETINGCAPDAYVIPKWLYDVLEIVQDDKPMWHGRKLDPWDKPEIRGQ